MANRKKIAGKEAALIAAILLLSLFLRFYPAAANEFPKGSDSYFHIRAASEIEESGSLFVNDPLTGTVNNYPPLFHVMLSALFRLSDPFTVARFIGPVLGFVSVVVFFLLVSSMFGRRAAIGSTFVYGTAAEVINKAVFASPENLGFLLIFLTLYKFSNYLKRKRKMHMYISAATATLTALTHPLSFIMLVVLLLAFFADLKKIAYILAVPVAAGIAWILYTNSLGAMTLIIPTSVTFSYVFFGFSPAFFALVIVGMHKAKNLGRIVPTYLIVLLAMLLPFYPERIFTFGIVLGAVIAGFGMIEILEQKSGMKYAAVAFIAAVALSQAVEINNLFGYARTEMTEKDYEALIWAKNNLPDGVIAGTWQVSGAWMPPVAGKNTILGAFQESVKDYKERRQDLYEIFTSSDKARIEGVMKKYGAEYVFIDGYEERALYNGATSRLAGMFPTAFENGYAHIFRVQ